MEKGKHEWRGRFDKKVEIKKERDRRYIYLFKSNSIKIFLLFN